MKKSKLFVLALLILMGLGLYLSLSISPTSSFSKKRIMAFDMMAKLSENYEIKYGLRYAGVSEAAKEGKYQRLGLLLSSNKILTKNEGRILLLNCLHDALKAFNSNPEFEQYMANYPFTRDNVFLSISVEPPGVSEVYYPDIASFSISRGRLEYRSNTIETPYLYGHEEEEIYEDALKIVEAQMQ